MGGLVAANVVDWSERVRLNRAKKILEDIGLVEEKRDRVLQLERDLVAARNDLAESFQPVAKYFQDQNLADVLLGALDRKSL